ncbi:hypothetical protein [Botrimarina sp.]|uniref:hypothetical protein n=1 Tax=Botrimarina sp. TaxID=2795802 RepID=UPI0032F07E63
MNYLAHALPFLEKARIDPYELAGAAVPDWLGVAARRTKCRSRDARPHLEADDPRAAALARGVCRHHADDAWFHDSPAFGRLSLAFAKELRESLGESTSLRPWFLGHVLVELLLDDALSARQPDLLDRYYAAIAQADPAWVAATVERFSRRDVGRLAEFVERFVEVRFLEDYAHDERLTYRLNQVMSRVRLDPLPAEFPALLPPMRGAVNASVDELLAEPTGIDKKAAELETDPPGPA